LSGAYDLGVAKVGLGISNLALMQGNVNDTFVAAAVPLGALTLNANWGSRKFDNLGTQAVKTGAGNVTAEGTVNGYGIGAAYALSKRTQIVANYVSYDDVVNASNKNTTTKVYIDHSF
jgi:predicted porin